MNEGGRPGKTLFGKIWRAVCTQLDRRPVGQNRGFARARLPKCPPQAVENRKIRSVLGRPENGSPWAGTSLAKMGNTLGHPMQLNVMQGTARRLHQEHLTR